MKWFRMWSGVRHHPKVLKLPAIDRWHWLCLLCVANESTPRGSLPPTSDIALELRVSLGKAASILNRFREVGLLDAHQELGRLVVHDWEEWQPVSDDAAVRMAAFRQGRSEHVQNNDRTRSEHPANNRRTSSPPEEDTETDTDPETENRPRRRNPGDRRSPQPPEEAEEKNGAFMPVHRRLRELGIAAKREELESAIAESGSDCVMHCIDEAERHNKLSLAYVDAVRRRHLEDGCPSWGRTRSERIAENARRQA